MRKLFLRFVSNLNSQTQLHCIHSCPIINGKATCSSIRHHGFWTTIFNLNKNRIISIITVFWWCYENIMISAFKYQHVAFHFVYFTAEYMSASGGGYSSYDNEDQGNRGRRTPVTPPKKHSNALPSECHTAWRR